MKKRLICMLLTAVLLLGLCPAVSAAGTEMAFSDALVAYIKQGEGFSPQAITDGTGWYIGYGCLVNKGDYPNGITEPEAEALLRQEGMSSSPSDFLLDHAVEIQAGISDPQLAALHLMAE